MFCKKCGTQLKSGTFCPKCGTNNSPINNTGSFNTTENVNIFNSPAIPNNWGNSSFYSNTDTALKNQKNKWLIPGIVLGVTAVIIIIAIVFIVGMFTRHGSSNAENAVNDYYSAYQNRSTSDLIKCVPNDFLNDVIEEYDIDESEIEDELQDLIEDRMDDSYKKPIESIILKFNDAQEAAQRKVGKYADDLDTRFKSITNDFDTDDIDKLIEIDTRLRFEDKNEKKLNTDNVDINVYKYNGRWYMEDAMSDIVMAATIAAD